MSQVEECKAATLLRESFRDINEMLDESYSAKKVTQTPAKASGPPHKRGKHRAPCKRGAQQPALAGAKACP